MVSVEEIRALDVLVEDALASGDEAGLDVLAYGEISVVLRLGAVACKRLPVFGDQAALVRYRDCLDRYLAALGERGIRVVDTELMVLERSDGSRVGYCVQPLLARESLLVEVVRAVDEARAVAVFARVVEAICATVGPRLGLDAQLSNWALVAGELVYLDVTTPLLRDQGGASLLDADLFLAALPAPLRRPIKWWVLEGITDKYHDPRGVIVDAIANLYKEQLTDLIPAFIRVANEHVSPAITPAEVSRYYKSDARTWAALLWLRHADRVWHRRVLRRPYPFLLPRRIDRHV